MFNLSRNKKEQSNLLILQATLVIKLLHSNRTNEIIIIIYRMAGTTVTRALRPLSMFCAEIIIIIIIIQFNNNNNNNNNTQPYTRKSLIFSVYNRFVSFAVLHTDTN